MPHIPTEFLDDPLGYGDDLQDALADADLTATGPPGEKAAYRVALAFGRCRTHGIDPGEAIETVLPLERALAAARERERLLPLWTRESENLAECWQNVVDQSEADELCAGSLRLRADAWATGVALNEAA